MNWEAIGAILEAVGALVLLIPLLYFAIQTGQNTRQITGSIGAMRLAAFERNIEFGNPPREFRGA